MGGPTCGRGMWVWLYNMATMWWISHVVVFLFFGGVLCVMGEGEAQLPLIVNTWPFVDANKQGK